MRTGNIILAVLLGAGLIITGTGHAQAQVPEDVQKEIEGLFSSDGDVSAKAVNSLEWMGGDVFPVLVDVLTFLSEDQLPETAEPLRPILESANPRLKGRMRYVLANTLAKIILADSSIRVKERHIDLLLDNGFVMLEYDSDGELAEIKPLGLDGVVFTALAEVGGLTVSVLDRRIQRDESLLKPFVNDLPRTMELALYKKITGVGYGEESQRSEQEQEKIKPFKSSPKGMLTPISYKIDESLVIDNIIDLYFHLEDRIAFFFKPLPDEFIKSDWVAVSGGYFASFTQDIKTSEVKFKRDAKGWDVKDIIGILIILLGIILYAFCSRYEWLVWPALLLFYGGGIVWIISIFIPSWPSVCFDNANRSALTVTVDGRDYELPPMSYFRTYLKPGVNQVTVTNKRMEDFVDKIELSSKRGDVLVFNINQANTYKLEARLYVPQGP